jgi:alpha-L-fucosidase
MAVNGEAVYATRQYSPFGEGAHLRFTQSKDSTTVYVLALAWPGDTLHLRSIRTSDGSTITMLGREQPLDWIQDNAGLHVEVPADLRSTSDHAWTFRVTQVAR